MIFTSILIRKGRKREGERERQGERARKRDCALYRAIAVVVAASTNLMLGVMNATNSVTIRTSYPSYALMLLLRRLFPFIMTLLSTLR